MSSQFAISTVSLFSIAAISCVFFAKGTTFRGINCLMAGSFLIPTWLTVSAFGIQCDLRVCLAIMAATAIVALKPRSLFGRLVIADLVVILLCAWQTFSEWYATGSALEPFFLSYGFWVLPYLVGRCSARSIEDLQWLGFCIVGVCGAFAFATLLENTLNIDVFEAVFGKKPELLFHHRKAERWGLIRCEGPYRHPIFLGTVCMLIFPWTVWLISKTVAKQRVFSAVGVLAAVIATLSTISRGPVLGIPVSLTVAAVLRYRRLGVCLILFGILCMLGVVARPDSIKDATLWFARISGEREKPIALEDAEELEIRSSSTTRLLIIEHYWKSVTHAGILGYGMTATNTFPPNVPHVPFDEVTNKQFSIVDNTYILLALRGGWLLSLGFGALMIIAMLQFHGLEKREPSLRVLSRMMIGAIFAFSLVVFTVYPDYDFMFVFLWTVGISSLNLVPEEQTTKVGVATRRVRSL